MSIFRRAKKAPLRMNAELPRHIAIIMDGNGRWAARRGLPRKAGHAAGAEVFRKISQYCGKLGVEQLSVFAFSTENWNRPQDEVEGIMELLRKYLEESCEKLVKMNARLRFIGNLEALPGDIVDLIEHIDILAKDCTGIIVNVCINYGGRADILQAARKLAAFHAGGVLDAASVSQEDFGKLLQTDGMPDPDLLIRTGAEKRISNFMLWQAAYSELYFTDVLWPDFDEARLDEAIEHFKQRNRRYGTVGGV